jgi:hypothetical protein
LKRIQACRLRIYEAVYGDPGFRPRDEAALRLALRIARRMNKKGGMSEQMFDELGLLIYGKPLRYVRKGIDIFDGMSDKLMAADRYERRAFSRRKMAIRVFDELKLERARDGNPEAG